MGFIVFTCTIRSFDGYIPIHHWSDTAIHRKLQFYHIMYYSAGGLAKDEEIHRDLQELYRTMVPEPYYRGNVNFFGA